VSAFRAGFATAIVRMTRRAGLVTALLTIVLTLTLALLERRMSPAGAADRLVATVFRLVLPLEAFALSTAAVGLDNLREGLWPVARFGHSRPLAALGHTAGVAACTAAVALVAVAGGLLVTHLGSARAAFGASGPLGLPADLVTSGAIAVVASLGYAAWFAFGSTLGARGGGRGFVLTADFIFGPVGLLGLALPKGPAYVLVGLSKDVASGPIAWAAALASAAALALLTALRCR
jgi:hypothetical protein